MLKKNFINGQEQSNLHIFVKALLILALFFFLPTVSAVTETSSSSTVVLSMIGLAYLIGFFGFFGKHEWVSILGGLAMIAIGGYMLVNGVDLYKTQLTTYGGIFTIALGALFAIVPGLEIINDNT